MRDRIPTYPGRVKLVPVEGVANTYVLTRADEPTDQGTPLSKATFLTDATAAALGLTGDKIRFNFKWSDNLLGDDAMAFYQNGDAAPGGRFAFVFDSTATGEQQTQNDSESKTFFENLAEKLETACADFRKFFHCIFR